VYVIAGFGLMFLPAAVGDGAVPGPGERAEVAEPGLAGRPAVVGRHTAFGVIQVHVRAETGAEGEHVGDLPGSDRGAQPRRYLIAVHRCYLGGIDNRLDGDVASAAAQEPDQLVEGERAAVCRPHQRMPGSKRRLSKMKVQHHPWPRRFASNPGGTLSDNDR
jgi:hypothetical protein